MLISVILPAYNAEKTIKFSVESVLSQTHAELELLVILNGCTDNTEEILRSIKDDRIKILNSEKNRVIARNVGILNSRSDWIALQDSDDEWLSDKLKFQIEEIKSEKFDVIGTQINCVDENRIILPNKEPKRPLQHNEIVYSLLNGWNCIANASAIFRKSLIYKIGMYDDCFWLCEDYNFWLKSVRFARFNNLDNVLLNYMVKHSPNYDPVMPQILSHFYREAYKRIGLIK